MTPEKRPKRFEATHSYGIVLLLVSVSVTFALLAPDGEWAQIVGTMLLGATLIVVVRTSDARRVARLVAVVGAGLATLFAFVSVLVGGDWGEAGVRLVGALMVFLAPIVLARGIYVQIRRDGTITLRSIAGVIAVYLLLGMFFATVISAIEALDPPYFAQTDHATYEETLYFAYITLTTVGYGDFSPATSLGRTLAVVEALIGQLYLVTVVGVLVGNLGHPRNRQAEEDKPAAS
jgi:voltage-gated potassium channel Kch